MADSSLLFERTLYENLEKGYQYRITVSEFREVQYLNIRKYFQSYEGDFLPSTEGATIPLTIDIVTNLLDALLDLCSNTEARAALANYFQSKSDNLNEQSKTN